VVTGPGEVPARAAMVIAADVSFPPNAGRDRASGGGKRKPRWPRTGKSDDRGGPGRQMEV